MTRDVNGFLLVTAILLPMYAYAAAADDFDVFRREQREAAQKIKAEFQEFKDQQDREFADFLKGKWSEFDAFKGNVRIKEPKPKQIPVFVPVTRPIGPTTAPVAPRPEPVVIAPVIPPVVLVPPAPPSLAPLPKTSPSANTLEILFFGNAVTLNVDPQWKKYRLSSDAKSEAMSDFWAMMSSSQYEPTLQAINNIQRELNLDDWGGVTLWRAAVQGLQTERKSEQNLLLWFFLVKSGYDVRLGYVGADVHLFVAMKQAVYATKYIKVGEQTYYAVLASDHGDSIRSFYTYEASYPNKLKPLNIQSAATGFTKAVTAQRELKFDYKDKPIKISVPYDRQLVQYLDTFPQSEFELYFDTSGSALLRSGLLSELKKYTSTMNDEEAAEFLLTFVQQAFPYKNDEAQFGREKYFFIEESLYFPFNDCEDRSILYAWLVRELVGIKVVGLLYPGHMTTALALKNGKAGDATIEYKGERFVIADPTYIGAPVGTAMPSYANLKPTRVVDVR